MATLSITVPDDLVPRVMAALRALNPDQYATMTDGQVARDALRFFVRQTVTAYEEDQAAAAERAKVKTVRDAAWTDTGRVG